MTRNSDVPLGAYGTYVRRHIPLIVVCMVLGAIVGVAISHRIATYVGTASVFAPPLDLGPRGVPGDTAAPLREKDAVTPDTEALIATSTPVLTAVRKATGSRVGYAALAKRITVDAPPNTQVLSISFSARKPKVATAGAQAAATAFVDARARLIKDRQAADMTALSGQINALRDELASASTTTAIGGPININVARIARDVITNKIRTLQRTQIRLTTDEAGAGTVLRPAVESAIRPRLGREVPVTSGLLVGLLLGLLLGRLRPRAFLSARDLQRTSPAAESVDVIAIGPIATTTSRPWQRRRRSVDAGVRRLRNLTVASGSGLTLLTGPARRPVAAAVEAGFARSLARLGDGVALLVREDDATLLAALNIAPESLLDVDRDPVAAGQAQPEPGDIAAYRWRPQQDAEAVATTLRRSYRHVLVLAPGTPDATVCAMARIADRVVVSAERRRTRVREVLDAIRRLRMVGAPVTAALLVRAVR
jgi:capsular polysaccharide biosynthesis protein